LKSVKVPIEVDEGKTGNKKNAFLNLPKI